jgi:hypothetical protein
MSDLENLIEQVKQATDYQVNIKVLREKIKTDLHVAHNGGLFQVSPELIAFLNCWDQDEIYLEDSYHNPVRVNRPQLLELSCERYQQVMNDWHQEHERLKKIRKV